MVSSFRSVIEPHGTVGSGHSIRRALPPPCLLDPQRRSHRSSSKRVVQRESLDLLCELGDPVDDKTLGATFTVMKEKVEHHIEEDRG
jgi:hypothetical protein